MRPAPGALTLAALPDDLLILIFKRLPSRVVMPVCKAWRDLYRSRATSVTLTQKFDASRDEPLLDALRRSPSLAHLAVEFQCERLFCLDGQWPTGQLTGLRTLWVPVGWDIEQIPASLQLLDVVTVAQTSGLRAWWLKHVMDALLKAGNDCSLHVVSVVSSDCSDWLGFPRLEVGAWRGYTKTALAHVSAAAGRIRLRSLCARTCPGLEALPRLSGASCLTRLKLKDCRDLTSLEGLSSTNAPSLALLDVQSANLSSLDSLSGADLTRLTRLELAQMRRLTTVELGAAGMTALRELRLADLPLRTLPPLCRLPWLKSVTLVALPQLAAASVTGIIFRSLTDLRIHDMALPTLHALSGAAFPCLQLLSLRNCTKLSDLRGLSGGGRFPRLREIVVWGCTALTGLHALAGGEFPALTRLFVNNAPRVTSLAGLEGARLGGLLVLELRKCALASLACLDQCDLASVTRIDLSYDAQLKSLKGLPALPALRELDLSFCSKLSSYRPPRARLPALTSLMQPWGLRS